MTSGPRSGTLQSTTTGTIPYAGYHTVSINPVQVQNGQKFSVAVELTNPNNVTPLLFEYPYQWLLKRGKGLGRAGLCQFGRELLE